METMKRIVSYEEPNLDQLLVFAAAVDEGRLNLDSCEMYELLNCLVGKAQTKLGLSSQLRLGGATLAKDATGKVWLSLKRRGLCVQSGSLPEAA